MSLSDEHSFRLKLKLNGTKLYMIFLRKKYFDLLADCETLPLAARTRKNLNLLTFAQKNPDWLYAPYGQELLCHSIREGNFLSATLLLKRYPDLIKLETGRSKSLNEGEVPFSAPLVIIQGLSNLQVKQKKRFLRKQRRVIDPAKVLAACELLRLANVYVPSSFEATTTRYGRPKTVLEVAKKVLDLKSRPLRSFRNLLQSYIPKRRKSTFLTGCFGKTGQKKSTHGRRIKRKKTTPS